MAVERECFACGNNEHLIAGPGDLAYCHSCATGADAANTVPHSGPCSFCGKEIGAQVGIVNRRTLTAVVVANGVVLCSECLALMKDIAVERANP